MFWERGVDAESQDSVPGLYLGQGFQKELGLAKVEKRRSRREGRSVCKARAGNAGAGKSY